MCRRGVGPWVWAGLLTAVPLAAQDPPDRAQLEERLDSLVEQVEALEPRVRAERAAVETSTRERLDEPVDRVVDGLRIRAVPRDLDAAVDLFTTTWQEAFEPRFGAPPATVLRARLGYYDHRGEWNPRIGEGETTNTHFVQVSTAVDDRRVQAERALTRALLHHAPASVREWLATWGFRPRLDWTSARRQLASTPSASATACFAGDGPSCIATLGLRPRGWDATHVVTAWYSPEARIDVLTRHWGGYPENAPGVVEPAAAFLQVQREFTMPAGDDRITEERLVRPGGLRIRHDLGPASPETRASLWLLAVDLGGPDALDRLTALDPRTPVEEALEVMADRPLEALVDEWRRHLLADDDPADRRAPTRSTLAWVGLLALFAMTSTRWRVGR